MVGKKSWNGGDSGPKYISSTCLVLPQQRASARAHQRGKRTGKARIRLRIQWNQTRSDKEEGGLLCSVLAEASASIPS